MNRHLESVYKRASCICEYEVGAGEEVRNSPKQMHIHRFSEVGQVAEDDNQSRGDAISDS